LKSYRHLLDLAGSAYVVVAFLGRLPLAMSQLGTLLLVAGSTGSYGAGGVSAGALAVTNALGAPVFGALADRVGQRVVVLVQSLLGAAGLTAVVALASTGADWRWQATVAAVAGLAIPQVGPLARVRWRPIVHGGAQGGSSSAGEHRRLVDAAFSYEGSADEASFVLGPALVGVATAVFAPSAALILAAALLAVFGSWFAVHPSADLARRTRQAAAVVSGALLTATLVVLSGAQFAVGMIFGSAQAATSVLATAAGEPGLTGLLHAVLGVGSVIAGLAVAVLPETVGYETRLRIFATCLLVLATPLMLVDSLGSLAGVLLVLGFAVAPYMISVFSLAERLTPPHRTGAAMTVLAGATGLGYAAGSSLAGRFADWGGHTPAFAVTVLAGGLATLLAWAAAPRLRAEQHAAAGSGVAPRPPEPARAR